MFRHSEKIATKGQLEFVNANQRFQCMRSEDLNIASQSEEIAIAASMQDGSHSEYIMKMNHRFVSSKN